VTVPCAIADVLPWASIDLGSPLVPGGAQAEDAEKGSCWSLCADGRGFQGIADEGHFLHQEVEGDFVLTVRIEDLFNADVRSQAGLMARESNDAADPSARQGSLLVLGNGSIAAMRRPQPNNATTQEALAAGDRWLRLERKGSAVLASHSPDGAQWTPLEDPLLAEIEAVKIFVGLAASPRALETALSRPAMEARFCAVQLVRSESGQSFRRGDTNADGQADISDAVTTLGFLFLGNPEQLACDKSADTNDDGKIDLSDPVALLIHLFLGAPAPPAPFGACGVDPTEDGLACAAPGPCE
jgi:regulation of enolase protein 1 (concanavalin A-like superfamily)